MPYQIEPNPVSFHIPHLGKICTNNDNIDEKKKVDTKNVPTILSTYRTTTYSWNNG